MIEAPAIKGWLGVAVVSMLLIGLSSLHGRPFRGGRQEEPILRDLLFPEAQDRNAREAGIRAALDTGTVARLLDDAAALPDIASRRLASILSCGGPWMPALIQSLERPGPSAALVRSILESSLDKRPYLREIVPPGVAATTMIDPFGHLRPGEGKFIYFPGTWTRGVRLDEFLDRINETALPAFPFVLHPALGSDPELVLEEMPLEGPAALVLERILSGFNLRITFLETVALVEKDASLPADSPGLQEWHGCGVQDQFGTDQRSDAILLKSALSILSDPKAHGEQRRTAYKALAYLDLPGLFEGYYRALGEGELHPALDILLYGPMVIRLAALMIDSEDRSILEFLLQALHALDRRARPHTGEADPGIEPEGSSLGLAGSLARRRQLSRLLFVLSKASCYQVPGENLRITPLESILSLLDPQAPDGALAGLRAVLYQAPFEPDPGSALVDRLCRWPPYEGEAVRLLDACLRDALAEHLDDGRLALLVRNPVTRAGALEAAAVLGSRGTLEALMEEIRSGRAIDLQTIRCAAAILGRMQDEEGAIKRTAAFADSSLPLPGRIALAGLALILSSGNEEAEGAADFLFDRLEQGGQPATAAARMISFLGGDRLLDRLERLHDAASGQEPEILAELERAVLRCASRDSIIAGRLRLGIRRFEDRKEWSRLVALLGLLERLSGGDYLRVAVDF